MNSSILDAKEASLYLKITPELLFHYVKYGAKGRDGGKLATIDGSAATRFSRDDLKAYDAYLREPWPSPDGIRAPMAVGKLQQFPYRRLKRTGVDMGIKQVDRCFLVQRTEPQLPIEP